MAVASLADARRRAALLYPRSRAFQGSYLRGAQAAVSGDPIDASPYVRTRRSGWGVAYHAAWTNGYLSIRRPTSR